MHCAVHSLSLCAEPMQAARARRASNDRGGVVYRRGCIVQHHSRVERNVVPRTNPSMSKSMQMQPCIVVTLPIYYC